MPEGPLGGPRPFAENNCIPILRVVTSKDGTDIVAEILRTIQDGMGEDIARHISDRIDEVFGDYRGAKRETSTGIDVLMPIDDTIDVELAYEIKEVLRGNLSGFDSVKIQSVEIE